MDPKNNNYINELMLLPKNKFNNNICNNCKKCIKIESKSNDKYYITENFINRNRNRNNK
jgi:polyferredoxin